MNSCSSPVGLAIAALLIAAAMPAYGNGRCHFSAVGNAGLNFGTLNQVAGGTVTATATLQVGNCNKGTFMMVTVNNPNQTMTRQFGTETIAYSVSGTFNPGTASSPGNGQFTTWTMTGTILPAAYRDVVAGNYAGSVTVSVAP